MTNVPRETLALVEHAKSLILAESSRQNLIAASTIEAFDIRHVRDSTQLADHVRAGVLIDVGSGGGMPGLILACILPGPIHLIEPRAKRASFLSTAVAELGLDDRATVHACKVERVALPPAATITARAVASLSALFGMAAHLADENTRWVLPKGKSAASELEQARQTWQGAFRLVPSVTDADAAIVIAEGVRRRHAR
jgi:16S rRNA (guanine527-N7)-methyltransferase